MKARGRMNHTLGPTALIHFTRHKCHGHITNTKAQQMHNNEYRYIFVLPPDVAVAVLGGWVELASGGSNDHLIQKCASTRIAKMIMNK